MGYCVVWTPNQVRGGWEAIESRHFPKQETPEDFLWAIRSGIEITWMGAKVFISEPM